MKKEFKKCGSGDNVCNCNSADECGYSIPYENTTKKSLAECKDEVAKAKGFNNWYETYTTNRNDYSISDMMDEAAELYASQFVKKDSVSSDVEQADHSQKASDKFAAFVKTKYDQKDHNTMYLFDNMIDAIYQSVLSGLIDECFGQQSTQQPAITTLQQAKIMGDRRLVELEHEKTVLQQANAELQKEVDKWRDSANYYKDTYPVIVAELEKQNAELVNLLKDCREAIPAEMGNNPLWARINDIIAASEGNK